MSNKLTYHLSHAGVKPKFLAQALRAFIQEQQIIIPDPEKDEQSLIEDCKIFYKHLDGRWWNEFHIEDLK